MHRIDKTHIRLLFRHHAHSVHDVLEGLAVVLPAMGGEQHHPLLLIIDLVEPLALEGVIVPHCGFQSVDDGVAGDIDILLHTLPMEVCHICLGGSKMQIGNIGGQGPVHLLREGGVFVKGTQPRFHMAHLHLGIERSQSRHKGGGSVAVDQHQIRLGLFQHIPQTAEGLDGDAHQGLGRLHDIQIVIRGDLESLQHLIQHFPVLGGDADNALHFFPALQFLHQRRHFDGFRTGAENRHHFDLIHVFHPFPGHLPSPCPALFPAALFPFFDRDR